jgi:hypothetical protein
MYKLVILQIVRYSFLREGLQRYPTLFLRGFSERPDHAEVF